MSMLARGTQMIINQVQAMKRMVDDFRQVCPAAAAAKLRRSTSTNWSARCSSCTKSSSAVIVSQLAGNLPAVLGDATQLRQVIHNTAAQLGGCA